MNVRRGLVGTAVGAGILAAVALGVFHWVVLPARADGLERERTQLAARIGNLDSHLKSWHLGQDGDLDRADLPAATALPAHAGDLLADLTAHGAVDLAFAMGSATRDGNAARRELRAEFAADVRSLGAILDRLALWRPAVALTDLSLAEGAGGRIRVSMELMLLGRADA